MSDLRNNNFIFTFKKIPNIEYSLQRVNLPSFSLGSIPIPSPILDYPIPGDKIAFGAFTFDFIVDENLGNYKEMWDWVKEIASFDRSSIKVETDVKNMMSDGTLTILSNNKNPLVSIDYVDCFPQNVGDLQFDTTGASDIISCPVTLEYSYFKFVE